jgi:hypothetical protein
MNRKQFATLCLAIVVVLGLAYCTNMVKPTPPVGCEQSVIWKYSPWSHVVLKTMVDSTHILAGTQNGAASYAVIKDSAQLLIVMLSGGNITYGQIQSVQEISAMLVSTLGLIFAPGQVINKCDADILVSYLKMI